MISYVLEQQLYFFFFILLNFLILYAHDRKKRLHKNCKAISFITFGIFYLLFLQEKAKTRNA